jgi:hypothetical protein
MARGEQKGGEAIRRNLGEKKLRRLRSENGAGSSLSFLNFADAKLHIIDELSINRTQDLKALRDFYWLEAVTET